MKQQPDHLFRNKLRNYSKPVPDSAWNRIESGIKKKPYPFFKLAIAASLLLMSICIYIFRPSSLSEQQSIVQRSSSEPDQAIQRMNDPVTEEEILKSGMETKAESTIQKLVEEKGRKPSSSEETEHSTPLNEERTYLSTLKKNSFEEEMIVPENTMNDKTDSIGEIKDDSENLFIVFTAEDTKEYLSKRIQEEATTNEENASTFKKVLIKARNLKTNQDPFGELRQKKNEILALNFKSDKRGQKK